VYGHLRLADIRPGDFRASRRPYLLSEARFRSPIERAKDAVKPLSVNVVVGPAPRIAAAALR
jgi:hypothetical protein